jgi:hypothetical protein
MSRQRMPRNGGQITPFVSPSVCFRSFNGCCFSWRILLVRVADDGRKVRTDRYPQPTPPNRHRLGLVLQGRLLIYRVSPGVVWGYLM